MTRPAPGRSVAGENAKQSSVWLSARLREVARRLGDGSVSTGVRVALEDADGKEAAVLARRMEGRKPCAYYVYGASGILGSYSCKADAIEHAERYGAAEVYGVTMLGGGAKYAWKVWPAEKETQE